MPKPRHDGWTPPRRAAFLAALAVGESVDLASALVGLSRASAYALARRDAGFAAAWRAARDAFKPLPDLVPPRYEDLDRLPTAMLLHRLRSYNIGRGQTLLAPRNSVKP